jgi:hypothetical protein
MSDPKNKWAQPEAAPPPMFFGKKERDLVKQVNDELAERIVGQSVAYYAVSIQDSNFHDIYGEAIDKVSYPPIRVYAYVVVNNAQTADKYGYEYQTSLTVNFNSKRLTDDQQLYVRVGDFIQYGDEFYEIVKTYNDTRYYFGQVEHKFQVSADCVKAREGVFRVAAAPTRPKPVAPPPRPNIGGITTPQGATGTTGAPGGDNRSIQFNSNGSFGGTSQLTWLNNRHLEVTGNAAISGDIRMAGTLIGASPVKISGSIDITDSSGTVIASLGSSSLGPDVLSSSLGYVTNLTASNLVSASYYYGDGSNLTNLPAAAISSYTNSGNNRVITSVDATGVTGEANLTFDGSVLTVVGALTASTNISASSFYGDGSTLSGIATSGGIFTTLNASNAYVTSSLNIGGTGTPAAQLQVSSSGDQSLFQVDGATNGSILFVTGSGRVGIGTSSPSQPLHVSGNVRVEGTVSASAGLYGTDLHLGTNAGSAQTTIYLEGGSGTEIQSTGGGNLNITAQDGDFYLLAGSTKELHFGTDGTNSQVVLDISGNLGIGTDSPDYTLDVAGDAGFNEYLYHNGDTNTYMRFRADQIDFVAGGLTFLTLDEATNDKVIINNGGNNIDLRVEGENDANLICTDAANDMVGIGTSTPSHLLTVAGASHLSGGLIHKRTAVSTNYTASSGDYIIGVTSAPLSIEFDALSFAAGQAVVVKDETGTASPTNSIMLSASASQTIDGLGAVEVVSPYGSVLLYSDGANWFVY